jgi:hypothetical protein
MENKSKIINQLLEAYCDQPYKLKREINFVNGTLRKEDAIQFIEEFKYIFASLLYIEKQPKEKEVTVSSLDFIFTDYLLDNTERELHYLLKKIREIFVMMDKNIIWLTDDELIDLFNTDIQTINKIKQEYFEKGCRPIIYPSFIEFAIFRRIEKHCNIFYQMFDYCINKNPKIVLGISEYDLIKSCEEEDYYGDDEEY